MHPHSAHIIRRTRGGPPLVSLSWACLCLRNKGNRSPGLCREAAVGPVALQPSGRRVMSVSHVARFFLMLLIAGQFAGSVMPHQAHAAVGGCISDPLVLLSNGEVMHL